MRPALQSLAAPPPTSALAYSRLIGVAVQATVHTSVLIPRSLAKYPRF